MSAHTPYVSIQLPTQSPIIYTLKGEGGTHSKGKYAFDIRFPRHVLAEVMGISDRSDWRICEIPETEISNAVDRMKGIIGPLDLEI